MQPSAALTPLEARTLSERSKLRKNPANKPTHLHCAPIISLIYVAPLKANTLRHQKPTMNQVEAALSEPSIEVAKCILLRGKLFGMPSSKKLIGPSSLHPGSKLPS